MRKDFVLFDLLLIFAFTVFTMVLLYAPIVGSVPMFLPLACLMLVMIAAFNLGLQRGMLLAITMTFFYGSYVIYDAMLTEDASGINFAHVLWMIFFPLGGTLAGNLSRVVTRYKREMDSKQTLEKLVAIDANTGFYKQQEFFKKLDEEFFRARRYKSNFSILLIQINNYEELQMIYGEVDIINILRAVAGVIQTLVRISDAKFLIGNDMLGLFLAETNEEGARVVIEKLHLSLERITVTVRDDVKKVVRIKPSIALATITDHDKDALEMFDRAKSELVYDKG